MSVCFVEKPNMVTKSPSKETLTDIKAFYGYDLSIKKRCFSYEGNGDIGVSSGSKAAELYGVSRKWSKLQGMPKTVKTLDDIRRYRALTLYTTTTALLDDRVREPIMDPSLMIV